jgi:hypothetical protein
MACSFREASSETLPDWEDGASSLMEGGDRVEEAVVLAGPSLVDTPL